jgi:hypothetical protein
MFPRKKDNMVISTCLYYLETPLLEELTVKPTERIKNSVDPPSP